MITQSCFPLYVSLLKSCWSMSSDLSDRIQSLLEVSKASCTAAVTPESDTACPSCSSVPLTTNCAWKLESLKVVDGSWLGGAVKLSYLQWDATKELGFLPLVPQCQCWASAALLGTSPERTEPLALQQPLCLHHAVEGKKASHSTGLHHLVLHQDASSLDDPTTDHLVAVSCRLASSHM